MRNLFIAITLLLSVTAHAQTNRQVFIIASEAVAKHNGAEEHLKNSGLRYVEDKTNLPYQPDYHMPSYYECIKRIIYIDGKDRLWSYMVIGVPHSDDAVWQIHILSEFSSSNSLAADMESAGFKQIGIDPDDPEKITILWRKHVGRYYDDIYKEMVDEYVIARMLVLNSGGRYICSITFLG